ncbi:MAG TPA: hemolysin family protein [Chitinophagaceae bacterium]|nr:hemolysin family protein [Chitinophagaceae bacterium]
MTFSLIIPWISIWIILTVISGLEYAYLASNKLTIEIRKKTGTVSGQRVAKYFDEPDQFWSATVLSFYILLVSFVFITSQVIEEVLVFFPFTFAFFEEYFYLRIILDFFIISILVISSVGFIAKRTFENSPEAKLENWSLFINILSTITAPFAKIFVKLSEFILKYLFNVTMQKEAALFERINIHNFVRQSIQGYGNIDEANKELFQKASQLTSVKVRNCMTPRSEAIGIEKKQSIAELKRLFTDTKLSKIIVYDKDLDHIIGYVHHLDLVKKPKTIESILFPILTVPETMSAIDLINRFTTDRKSIAWVIDEYGGTAGFVTMEDVLEEIFGDILDEYDVENYMEQSLDNSAYLFSGRLEVGYLNKKYNLKIPTNVADTLSGYVINRYGRIPTEEERIILDRFEIEIIKVSNTRIETLKLRTLM